ncbi:hypothetical protein BKA80DRAFT_283708 [Phyllosticta citrichinensis]
MTRPSKMANGPPGPTEAWSAVPIKGVDDGDGEALPESAFPEALGAVGAAPPAALLEAATGGGAAPPAAFPLPPVGGGGGAEPPAALPEALGAGGAGAGGLLAGGGADPPPAAALVHGVGGGGLGLQVGVQGAGGVKVGFQDRVWLRLLDEEVQTELMGQTVV